MTEQEFKTAYIKSFLEAYKTVVDFKEFCFTTATVPTEIKELLNTAEERADAAWQKHLKEFK